MKMRYFYLKIVKISKRWVRRQTSAPHCEFLVTPLDWLLIIHLPCG